MLFLHWPRTYMSQPPIDLLWAQFSQPIPGLRDPGFGLLWRSHRLPRTLWKSSCGGWWCCQDGTCLGCRSRRGQARCPGREGRREEERLRGKRRRERVAGRKNRASHLRWPGRFGSCCWWSAWRWSLGVRFLLEWNLRAFHFFARAGTQDILIDL